MITRYIYIAIAVIMLGMAASVYTLKKENNALHEANGTLKAQVTELAGAIKLKDKDIDLCNQRTQALKTESDKRAADAEKARTAARIAAKENAQLANELLTRKRTTDDVCKQADDVFTEYSKIRKDREAHGINN